MILFLTEYLYTYNLNGASSFSSSHLRFLVNKFPEEQIKVILFNENNHYWKEEPDFSISNIIITHLPIKSVNYRPLGIKKIRFLYRKTLSDLINEVFLTHLTQSDIDSLRKCILSEKDVKYIWCEHLGPLLYLNLIGLPSEYKAKVVFSHHDFWFKLLLKRRGALKDRVRSFLVKRIELSILRDINYFVSGSSSEIAYARKFLSEHSKSQLLPCLYPDVKGKKRILSSSAPVKIYHLGTASATANRLGLVSFMKEVFPKIEHLDFSLEFIGNVKEFLTTAFPEYIDHPKIKIHGYVENMDSLLEANMIHIIPYSGYTGTRTRVGSIIRFQPCIVGYLNLSDNYPILKDRENCIMVLKVNEFIDALSMVIQDQSLRMQLSENVLNDFKQYEDHLFSNESIFL